MASLEAYLTQDGSEKYKKACYLQDEASKSDPESEPYKSKYEARKIYQEMKESLLNLANEDPENKNIVFSIAAIDVKLGANYTDTDEVSCGEKHLESCIALLKEERLEVKACNILQHAYNQLGILWTGRRKPDTALEYLQKAEQLYKDFKHNVGNAPYMIDEHFGLGNEDAGMLDQKRSSNFEDTYTHSLYYLAQVHTQLDQNEKGAEYCHDTLRRQLDTMKYEPLDWALNAATLSQYYITVKKFKMARHCLASATTILKEKGEPSTKVETIYDEDSQADIDRKEKMPRSWADMYRCWAKYGMALLEASKDKLFDEISNSEELDHNADKSHQATDTCGNGENINDQCEEGTSKGLIWFNLEVTAVEEQITDQYVKVFDEVRPIFLCIQKWLLAAKEFYVLDGHCTDHVEIVQDYSRAFKELAFFEMDMERQCKMHKRRIDMLKDVLKELNPQHYMLICRQLMFEIAEAYSNMLDLKLAKIEESGATPTQHSVKKINTLTLQSKNEFEEYVDTLKTPEKVLPPKYADEDERPALIAHFHMGRLYSKFITFDVQTHLQNMKKTIDMYQYIVDYCKNNPDARNKVKSEVEICEEMVQLLPLKMERIRQKGAIF